MLNDLSQLDELVESDMLEALGGTVSDSSATIDEISIEDFDEEVNENNTPIEDENIKIENIDEDIVLEDFDIPDEAKEDVPVIKSDDSEVTTVKSADLASLLSQLLNNKTIEITIKIKD